MLDKYQAWVRNGLDTTGKSAVGLAKVLGIAPARITEITKGTRKVQLAEVPKKAFYLGLQPPADELQSLPYLVGQVRIMGRIEAGVWRERAESPQDNYVPCVVDSRFPLDTQKAFLIATHTHDNSVHAGDFVITANEADLSQSKRRLIVVRLHRQELESLALAEIVQDNQVRFLIPNDLKNEKLSSVDVVGRVIALHRPLA